MKKNQSSYNLIISKRVGFMTQKQILIYVNFYKRGDVVLIDYAVSCCTNNEETDNGTYKVLHFPYPISLRSHFFFPICINLPWILYVANINYLCNLMMPEKIIIFKTALVLYRILQKKNCWETNIPLVYYRRIKVVVVFSYAFIHIRW